MSIDFKTIPYQHSYSKNLPSIFDPSAKSTFPDFVVQMCLWNRETFIKNHQKIIKGSGWSNSIASIYRRLIQQATVICNFFPHVQNEPLVLVAFKNVFRNNRIMKIGQYRKNRVTKAGKLNITKDEMDLIKMIDVELARLIKQRDSFKIVAEKQIAKNPDDIKYKTISTCTMSGKNIKSLIDAENKLKNT